MFLLKFTITSYLLSLFVSYVMLMRLKKAETAVHGSKHSGCSSHRITGRPCYWSKLSIKIIGEPRSASRSALFGCHAIFSLCDLPFKLLYASWTFLTFGRSTAQDWLAVLKCHAGHCFDFIKYVSELYHLKSPQETVDQQTFKDSIFLTFLFFFACYKHAVFFGVNFPRH